ncbi:MAG: J domain-containing protein [Cyanobacteriota bacterium]
MADPYALLAIPPEATPAELKAAYHRQLRRFPAHSHPREFQQIRAAYEAIRAAGEHRADPLKPGPPRERLDPEVLAALEARVHASCRLSLTDLLRLTF